ncbi:MAG: type VI secretion system protein TssL, long form [Rhodospirillales bacterium]
MSTNNPFGLPDDGERTVIRPNPGGRRADGGGAIPIPSGPAPAPMGADMPRSTRNPLLGAATELFGLIARLGTLIDHGDVDGLHHRIVNGVRQFEATAAASGASAQTLQAARYAICATIDDLILNTPWGARGGWAQRSMVGIFYNEREGGERFYDMVAHLMRQPANHIDVLELSYACLALGFRGKLRVAQRGATEHARVLDALHRSIREVRGQTERELSPHWHGAGETFRPLRFVVPIWVVGAIAAVLLVPIFLAFNIFVNGRSDMTFADLAGFPPAVAVARAPVPPPVQLARVDRLRKFLEPEIREGLVSVTDDATATIVRFRGEGMFDSGSATVTPRVAPVVRRVAEALKVEPGAVTIVGYSDNRPIRSLRFPSNWHLSLARASAVMDGMVADGLDASRLKADGKGEADPIASNDTPEGRALNRRIDVRLAR